MRRPPSLLVISSAEDDRASTVGLLDLVEELRRRAVVVTVWFLRGPSSGEAELHVPVRPSERWGSGRIVDSLRTWAPTVVLDVAGMSRLAARLRGLRLRWWYRQARPDAILLDDGLGRRVVPQGVDRVPVVVRLNDRPPAGSELEEAADSADVWVVTPSTPVEPSDGRVVVDAAGVDASVAVRLADPAARREARRAIGLPEAVPLLAGWGYDGWLDGPDLFVRCLWAVSTRHGVPAHGVWMGPTEEPEFLREEAVRCGLGDRYHVLPQLSVEAVLSCDAVLLPYRSADERVILPEARLLYVSGLEVVAFPNIGGDGVRTVPMLDLDAAAAELADVLGSDRSALAAGRAHLAERATLADEIASLLRSPGP